VPLQDTVTNCVTAEKIYRYSVLSFYVEMEPKSEIEPTIPAPESVGIGEPKPNDAEVLPEQQQPYLKALVETVAESAPVTIVMSLFTIWALFSDDIRLAAAPKEADEAFVIVITIAFFLFATELIAGCFYKEGYLHLPSFTEVPNETFWGKVKRIVNFGSFYFWLDVIATVSLVFEVLHFLVTHPLPPLTLFGFPDSLDHWR
jgi:hypothetical protein